MTQRKYVLQRISAGDYLLLSNDAQTVWRIARYEDGPSHGVESMARDEWWLWGGWRWIGAAERPATHEDIEDWNRWQMCVAGCKTRSEAIDEALMGER